MVNLRNKQILMKDNSKTIILVLAALSLVFFATAAIMAWDMNKLKNELQYQKYYNGTLRDTLTEVRVKVKVYKWEIEKIDSIIKNRENNVKEAIDSIDTIADSILYSEWADRYLQLR